MKFLKSLVISSSIMLSTAASAGIVDLSTWQSEGQGNWQVQPGNDTVFQSINGQPTVFYKDGSSARDTSISGEITVKTTSDDDYIGFVLGYQSGELASTSSDFWLIDWKQQNQGAGSAGLALSHIVNGSTADYWGHTNGLTEIARGSTLGSSGWADFTSYTFDIVHTASLIEVKVNGNVELSVSNTDAGVSEFTDGAYGFYNYSQSSVEYSGVEANIVPTPSVPEPSTLAIFALGFAGLVSRKFKK